VKTISLKKVSAVAVASLGFGLLSVVPAQSAVLNDAALTTVIKVATVDKTSAGFVNTSTAITIETAGTGVLTGAIKLIRPDGTTAGYAGSSFSDATATVVGTAANTTNLMTYTLTAGVINQTGLWTIKAIGDSTGTTTPTTAANIDAVAAGNTDTTTFPVYAAAPSYSGGTGRVVTSATAISQTLNGVATLNIVSDATSASYAISSSGVGSISSVFADRDGFNGTAITANDTDVVSNNNGVNTSGGVTWTPNIAGKSYAQVRVASAVSGTTTVSVTPLNSSGTPGTPVTATITWGATPVVAAGTTTAFLAAGDATSASSDATVIVAKAVGTQAGNILMRIKDQDGNVLFGQAVAATITGPGLIKVVCGTSFVDSAGDARTSSDTCTSSEDFVVVSIQGDGTSGAGVVTVTSGTTTLTTKTVYFYDSPATVEAKQNHKVLSTAGGAAGIAAAANGGTGASIAQTPAVILTVKDKNGILVPGLTAASTSVTAVSSDTTVMSETITMAASDGSGAANTAAGTYNVQVSSVAKASGSTATLKFRVVVSAALGTFVESAPLTYTLGGAPASVALSLDKSTYTVGQAATATLTLKDASGNAAADGDHANILTGALTSSLPITATLSYNATATTVSSLGGVAAVKFNAPVLGGAWSVTGTTGVGPATAAEKAKALSVTATITDANAGLLTQIDALNAKIVALNALIAKIMKKLGVK